MNRRYLVAFVIGALLLVSAVGTAAQAETRALLIGIGDYPGEDNDLPGSPIDLQKIRGLLEGKGIVKPDNIVELRDSDATGDQIFEALYVFARATGPSDHLIVHYSGHGTYLPDDDGDEEDGQDEAIVPYDALEEGVIDDDSLNELLLLAQGPVTVIMDSCHSGTATRAAAPAMDTAALADRPRYVTPGSVGVSTAGDRPENKRQQLDILAERESMDVMRGATNKRLVWAAASPLEVAWDSKGGVFTDAFVRGAGSGEADYNRDGVVENRELLQYVRSASEQYCERNPKCNSLTPELDLDEQDKDLLRAAVLAAPGAAMDNPFTNPGEELENGTDEALRIAVVPSHVALGGGMHVELEASRGGYLYLLDYNTEKKLVKLLPNEFSERRRAEAGELVITPDAYDGFAYTATEPTGSGQIVALITSKPIALDPLFHKVQSLTPMDDVEDFIDAINYALAETYVNEAELRKESIDAVIGYADYEVVR